MLCLGFTLVTALHIHFLLFGYISSFEFGIHSFFFSFFFLFFFFFFFFFCILNPCNVIIFQFTSRKEKEKKKKKNKKKEAKWEAVFSTRKTCTVFDQYTLTLPL
jgi:uncharacterized protein YacL